jgi:hypothetical protein
LRGAQRRGNPGMFVLGTLDCFALLAMTGTKPFAPLRLCGSKIT